MKYLGKGWEYRVYDLGNGRVRKIERNIIDASLRAFFDRYSKTRFKLFQWWGEVRRFRALSRSGMTNLLRVINKIPPELLGNPAFFSGMNYDQDRLTPLGTYLQHHSLEDNKRVLADYVKLLRTLLQYGLGETVFNFTINNGVDKKGRVVQMDLGEFTSDKDKMRAEIKTKMWLRQSSFASMPGGELKRFLCEEIDRVLTLENLEKEWGKNL